MKLKAIKSDIEYQEYLNWLDLKLDKNHPFDSPDGVNIQRVLLLVKQYEDTNYPIPKPEID
jgi:HTH-type transcriptional regulator/antitoxin HigA